MSKRYNITRCYNTYCGGGGAENAGGRHVLSVDKIPGRGLLYTPYRYDVEYEREHDILSPRNTIYYAVEKVAHDNHDDIIIMLRQ